MFFSAMCHVVAFSTLTAMWLLLPSALLDLFASVFVIGSFLYCSYLLGSFLDTLPRFRVSAKKKAVLITGCDSGFGHSLAHRLDSIGYQVFACCQFPEGDGAMKLKNSTSDRLQILKLDVTSDESVQTVLKQVEKNLTERRLWAIVNNAGIITRGELEWTPLEDYKKQFEVNTFGVVRVTQAFLPLLRKSKGRVVATTSFGGRYTLPGLASYCMSKHASVSFCEGLRMEMAKFNVSVVTVEPFSYKSPMTEMETVLSNATETWSKANKELHGEYGGKTYIEGFKNSLRKFNELSANSNIHEVVDVMVEAVTCTSPHYKYTVGDFKSMSVFWLVTRLPLWMGYLIVRKYVTFDVDLERVVKTENGVIKKKKGL